MDSDESDDGASGVATVSIEDELNEVAGYLNAQHARLVDLTVRLLADESLWGVGVWSIEQYLAWRTGVSSARARQIAEVARRAVDLPDCVAAFGRGELSLDQVSAIVRRTPSWADTEVTSLSKMLTVRQIQRMLARCHFGLPLVGSAVVPADDEPPTSVGDHPVGPAADSNSGVEPGDHCSFRFEDDGRFHLHVETDRATGMIVEQALVEARDALFNAGHPAVNWVDALREIAERSLDAIPGVERRNRFRINVHLDPATGTQNGCCATDATGWRLPDAVRRHLTCDGLLSPVFVTDGVPVSVGRSQHIVPDRTRRIVVHRDGGCGVPGCGPHRFVEVHHIVHWEDGGPTDTRNLICLCPHHHRLHHRGLLGIAGNADVAGGVVFTDANGREITASGARPKPPGAPPPPPKGSYQHPLGERLESRWVYFNPPRPTPNQN